MGVGRPASPYLLPALAPPSLGRRAAPRALRWPIDIGAWALSSASARSRPEVDAATDEIHQAHRCGTADRVTFPMRVPPDTRGPLGHGLSGAFCYKWWLTLEGMLRCRANQPVTTNNRSFVSEFGRRRDIPSQSERRNRTMLRSSANRVRAYPLTIPSNRESARPANESCRRFRS